MKYDVTYSCGHKGTINLFGKVKDRESKIHWYETQADCPQCYKESLKRQAEAKKRELGLLDLNGTPAQIEWAEKIRLEMYNVSKRKIEQTKWFKNGLHNVTKEEIYQKGIEQFGEVSKEDFELRWEKTKPLRDEYNSAVKAFENVKSEISATWFIDNRFSY